MPPIVKTYLALCVLAAALVHTQRVSPSSLALSPRALPPDLELWRPVTALCYGDGFTPGWLLKLLLISHYGSQLEAAAAGTRGAAWAPLDAWFMLAWLLIGAGFMLAAAAARPSELLQPFLLTPTVFFLGTLCSFLPRPGSTRLPLDLTPWAGLAALALAAGPASALRASVGVGAALAVHLSEVLPTSAAEGPTPFLRLPQNKARRTLAAAALAASLLFGAAGVDLSAPPVPHSALLSAQAAALSDALQIDPHADFFGALANSSNVSVVMAGRRGNTSAPARGLAPTQLLQVYQHCADFWSTQHHRARLFNTVRQKRGGAALTSNEQLLAELERDLAEVLSQVDFKAEPSDEQVLKTCLRELPRPELQSLMPRPKMLETVAAHRESHVVAHDALALLGEAIEAYVRAGGAAAIPVGGEAALPAGVEGGAGAAGVAAGEGAAGGAIPAGESDESALVAVNVNADGSVGGGDVPEGGSAQSSSPSSSAALQSGDGADPSAFTVTAPDEPPFTVTALHAAVTQHLKTTLWAFSVPLEMSDEEVLAELVPAGLEVGAGTRAEMLADVHELRTQLRDESIARSVEDLRQRIALPSVLPPAAPADPPLITAASSTTPAAGAEANDQMGSGQIWNGPTVTGQIGTSQIGTGPNRNGRVSLPLNETARIESTALALELLTFHAADASMGDNKMVEELLILANLSVNQTREGAVNALAEAAQSWRLLSQAQDAVAALRSLFLRGLVSGRGGDPAEMEARSRKGAEMGAEGKDGAAGAAGIDEVAGTVEEEEEVMVGVEGEPVAREEGIEEEAAAAEATAAVQDREEEAEERAATEKEEEAAIEEAAATPEDSAEETAAAAGGPAATATSQAEDSADDASAPSDRTGPVSWPEHASIPSLVTTAMLGYEFPPLMSSDDVVAYLLKLMKLDHYNLPLTFGPRAWLENAVIAARAKGVQAASAPAAGPPTAGPPPPPLLLPQLAGTSAAALIGGAATVVSDDHFALLVAAVMQAVGVHTRLSVCCDPPTENVSGPTAGSEQTAEPALQSVEPACRLTAEVRVGKSPQRLNRWIAQHRKAQRALRKSVRGAVDIHFRRDHLGFLWLPLRWRPGAGEQLPGAPGANASFCMIYHDDGRYLVEGAPLDSRGMATGRERNDKVLCTL